MGLGRLPWVAVLLAAGASTQSLAQGAEPSHATKDQARLIFSLSAGLIGGKDLWSSSPQPIQPSGVIDTFALKRDIRSNLAIGFSGTYYPGATFGVMLEGSLVGLGFEDFCTHLHSTGSAAVASACQSIQGAQKAATSVILSVGPVARINSQSAVSPYARLAAGLIFSNQSSLSMSGSFESDVGPALLPVYTDDHESRVEPSFEFGLGFTAAVAKGYQLRWEVRDNMVGVQRVSAPTSQAGLIPPHELEFKHLFSMMIGFDVVLERRRGRRY